MGLDQLIIISRKLQVDSQNRPQAAKKSSQQVTADLTSDNKKDARDHPNSNLQPHCP